jgi:hypothetical protein
MMGTPEAEGHTQKVMRVTSSDTGSSFSHKLADGSANHIIK